MKVTCMIEIGNDADMDACGFPAVLTVHGEPRSGSGFVTLEHGDLQIDVRPGDLRAALDRCESFPGAADVR